MAMLVEYRKSSDKFITIKHSSFDNNQALSSKSKRDPSRYSLSPLRANCRNCGQNLCSLGYMVSAIFCDYCSDLSGEYEDTEDYSGFIYLD